MILPDVNVLVTAFNRRNPHQQRAQDWLEDAVAGVELLGLTDLVLGGTVRVVTHPRVFAHPLKAAEILDLLNTLLAADGVARVAPGPRHVEIFADLCRSTDARGGLVADAQHAAIAIEHGATWITLDRDFARFPGLRWRTPFA